MITVTKHPQGFTLSTVWNGYLVSENFIGYTLSEAKGAFRAKYRLGRG